MKDTGSEQQESLNSNARVSLAHGATATFLFDCSRDLRVVFDPVYHKMHITSLEKDFCFTISNLNQRRKQIPV